MIHKNFYFRSTKKEYPYKYHAFFNTYDYIVDWIDYLGIQHKCIVTKAKMQSLILTKEIFICDEIFDEDELEGYKLPIVVFDFDDILWDHVGYICNKMNININDWVKFEIADNDCFNEEQVNKVHELFKQKETYDNVNFYEGIERINSLKAFTYIISNVANNDIHDVKIKQLLSILNIPLNRLHMNVVTDFKSKTLPENTYIFIDDSPYNISKSNAVYNIMIRRPWNISNEANKLLKNTSVIMCNSLNEVIDIIENILKDFIYEK